MTPCLYFILGILITRCRQSFKLCASLHVLKCQSMYHALNKYSTTMMNINWKPFLGRKTFHSRPGKITSNIKVKLKKHDQWIKNLDNIGTLVNLCIREAAASCTTTASERTSSTSSTSKAYVLT